MNTYARVPVIPGPVLEIYKGDEMFPVTPEIAKTWFIAPENTKEHDFFNGKDFIPLESNLAELKARKIQFLNSKFTEFLSGFITIGEYTYSFNDSLIKDVLIGLTLNSPVISIFCKNRNGDRVLAPHTKEQLTDVLFLYKTEVEELKIKLYSLEQQVTVASTLDEINAITW